MKFDFQDSDFGSAGGYSTKEERYRYNFKQSMKGGDFDNMTAHLGSYAEFLEGEGYEASEIKNKLKSLISSQYIFSGLKKEDQVEFVQGLSDRQVEILRAGLIYEQSLQRFFGF